MNRKVSRDFMLALDIGTTKVCAVAARRNERKVIEVLGLGMHSCSGLSANGIVDLEDIVASISSASSKAIDHIPGFDARKAVVSVSGTYLQSQNSVGSLVLSKHGRGVTQDDIQQCIDAAVKKSVPKDYEVIHSIPRWFRLDDTAYIRDPIGMEGSVLEVDVHLITGRHSILKNIRRCVKKCGFGVELLVSQALASSESVLSEEEKDTGIALANIGGETTSLIVYYENCIYHSETFGLGGEDVTQDINHYFQTPSENAENLKKYSGSTLSDAVSEEETMEVVRFKNRRTLVVKRKRLCEIIEARIEQIIEEIARTMRAKDILGLLFGGIVLTGGTSMLEGLPEKTGELLKRDAYIGYPTGTVGYQEILSSPAYATVVGLLTYGFARRDDQTAIYGTGLKWVVRRIFQWTQDTF
ncbi:cell division protein FtsA [bacterium]|nr:cell division protein FtsA [bacterium]